MDLVRITFMMLEVVLMDDLHLHGTVRYLSLSPFFYCKYYNSP